MVFPHGFFHPGILFCQCLPEDLRSRSESGIRRRRFLYIGFAVFFFAGFRILFRYGLFRSFLFSGRLLQSIFSSLFFFGTVRFRHRLGFLFRIGFFLLGSRFLFIRCGLFFRFLFFRRFLRLFCSFFFLFFLFFRSNGKILISNS